MKSNIAALAVKAAGPATWLGKGIDATARTLGRTAGGAGKLWGRAFKASPVGTTAATAVAAPAANEGLAWLHGKFNQMSGLNNDVTGKPQPGTGFGGVEWDPAWHASQMETGGTAQGLRGLVSKPVQSLMGLLGYSSAGGSDPRIKNDQFQSALTNYNSGVTNKNPDIRQFGILPPHIQAKVDPLMPFLQKGDRTAKALYKTYTGRDYPGPSTGGTGPATSPVVLNMPEFAPRISSPL